MRMISSRLSAACMKSICLAASFMRRHALTDQLLTGRGWLHLSWKPFGVPRHYVAIDYYG